MVINGKNAVFFIAKRDIDALEEICFDYKDPKCKGEFCSRPTAVTVSSDPPTSDPPTSDPPTSDPPASDPPTSDPPTSDPPTSDPPTSDPPTSDPPSSEPLSDSPTVEHVLLPESQETFPPLSNDSTIFDDSLIY